MSSAGQVEVKIVGTVDSSVAASVAGAKEQVASLGQAAQQATVQTQALQQSVGSLQFSTLQQGIDKSMQLDRSIKDAGDSFRVFESSLGGQSSLAAADDGSKKIAAIAAEEQKAVAASKALQGSIGSLQFKTLAQGIEGAMGMTRSIKSAEDSYKVFETTLAGQAALKGAVVAEGAAGAGMEQFALKTTRARTELIVLAHEMLQGRFTRIPGSLMVMTEGMTGVTGATLAWAGGIALAAAGIGFLIYRVLEQKKELDSLQSAFQLTGRGAEFTNTMVQYEVRFLGDLKGATSASTMEFLRFASAHASVSALLTNEVGQLLPAFVKAYGKDGPEAAQKLLTSLNDLTLEGFQKLDREMLGLAPTEYTTIENLIRTGQEAQAASMILADLAKNTGVYIKSYGDQVYDIEQKIAYIRREMAGAGTPGDSRRKQIADLEAEEAAIKKLADSHDQQGKDNKYKNEIDDVDKINASLNERAVIEKKINDLTRDRADALAHSDRDTATKAYSALLVEKQKLTALDKQEDEKAFRSYQLTEEAKVASSKNGSVQRIRMAQEEVDHAKLLYGEESDEYQRAVIKLGTQRREAEQQATTAARQASRERETIARHEAEVARQIVRDTYSADLEIARLGIQGKRDELEAEVLAGTTSAAQKYTILKQFLADEYEAEIKEAEKERALYDAKTADYTHYTNQIRILHARMATDMAALDRQAAQANKQATTQEAHDWKDANQVIISSEDTLVRNLFSGRMTLVGALGNLALDLVEKEVAADLKYFTMRMLFTREELAMQKSTETGGMLVHLLTENQKTASTVAGVAARTTAQAAGAATGTAVEAAAGSVSILNAAKEAAAGAYSALAQIPYIGPFIAPAGAAVAFTAVAAFDTLTSLDTGTPQVPHDMLANIHADEGVVPAPFMRAIRSGELTLGGPQGGGGGGDLHVHIPGAPSRTLSRHDIVQAVVEGRRLGNKQLAKMTKQMGA